MAVPVYTFVSQPTSVSKNSSTTFNVNATLTPDATTLYWTINNGTSVNGDFSATSGPFVITGSTGSFSLGTSGLAAGGETFTIDLHSTSTSGTIYGSSSTITFALSPLSFGGGINIGGGITIGV